MAVKPKLPGMSGPTSAGQMKGNAQSEKFANPVEVHSDSIEGMDGLHNDIGEKSGFETTGYITKKMTPYGEAAKFNLMPPGMDIGNQEMLDVRDMPLKKLTGVSYPGDGWDPAPRDIPE